MVPDHGQRDHLSAVLQSKRSDLALRDGGNGLDDTNLQWAARFGAPASALGEDPNHEEQQQEVPVSLTTTFKVKFPPTLNPIPLKRLLYQELYGDKFLCDPTCRFPAPLHARGLTLLQLVNFYAHGVPDTAALAGLGWLGDPAVMQEIASDWATAVWHEGGSKLGVLEQRALYRVSDYEQGLGYNKDSAVTHNTLLSYALTYRKLALLFVNLFPQQAAALWAIACDHRPVVGDQQGVFLLLLTKSLVEGNLVSDGAEEHQKDGIVCYFLRTFLRSVACSVAEDPQQGQVVVSLPHPNALSKAAAGALKCIRLCIGHAYVTYCVMKLSWIETNMRNSALLRGLAAELGHLKNVSKSTHLPDQKVAPWYDGAADSAGQPLVTGLRVIDRHVTFGEIRDVILVARQAAVAACIDAVIACAKQSYIEGGVTGHPLEQQLKQVQDGLAVLLDFTCAGPQEGDRVEIFSIGTDGSLESSAISKTVRQYPALARVRDWVRSRVTAQGSGVNSLPQPQVWDALDKLVQGVYASLVFTVRPQSLATTFRPGPRGDLVPALSYIHETNVLQLELFTRKMTAERDTGTRYCMDLAMTRVILVTHHFGFGVPEEQLCRRGLTELCSSVTESLSMDAPMARHGAVFLLRAAQQVHVFSPAHAAKESALNEAAAVMMHTARTHEGPHYENIEHQSDDQETDAATMKTLRGHPYILHTLRSKILDMPQGETLHLERPQGLRAIAHCRSHDERWRSHLLDGNAEWMKQLLRDMGDIMNPSVLQAVQWLCTSSQNRTSSQNASHQWGKHAVLRAPCGSGKTGVLTFLVAAIRRCSARAEHPMPSSPFVLYVTNLVSVSAGVAGGYWLNQAMVAVQGQAAKVSHWLNDHQGFSSLPVINSETCPGLSTLGGRTEVVLATPEAATTPLFRSWLREHRGAVAAIVLDEAHTPLLDFSYRPAVLSLGAALRIPHVPVIYMSGTWPKPLHPILMGVRPFSDVGHLGPAPAALLWGAGDVLHAGLELHVMSMDGGQLHSGFTDETFTTSFAYRNTYVEDLGSGIVRLLLSDRYSAVFGFHKDVFRPALVQVPSKDLAEQLAMAVEACLARIEPLLATRLRVAYAHSDHRAELGGMETNLPDDSGRVIGILVCTSVVEMGVNFLTVCSLVQVVPRSLFSMVQFAWRGGRGGQPKVVHTTILCPTAARAGGMELPGSTAYEEAGLEAVGLLRDCKSQVALTLASHVLGLQSVLGYARVKDVCRRAYLTDAFTDMIHPRRELGLLDSDDQPDDPFLPSKMHCVQCDVCLTLKARAGAATEPLVPVPVTPPTAIVPPKRRAEEEHATSTSSSKKKVGFRVSIPHHHHAPPAVYLEFRTEMARAGRDCWHCGAQHCDGCGNACPRGLRLGVANGLGFVCCMCDRVKAQHPVATFNAFSKCCTLAHVCGSCFLPDRHDFGQCASAIRPNHAPVNSSVRPCFRRRDPVRGLVNFLIRGAGYGARMCEVYQLIDRKDCTLMAELLNVSRDVWKGSFVGRQADVQTRVFHECKAVLRKRLN